MENSLTFWEMWLIFFGFGYLVNHHTKEIHRLYFKHHNCQMSTMSKKNSEYVTKSAAKRLIKKYHYNGCRWCWPVQDAG